MPMSSSSDDDRFGSLPDSILHQILSLVPTKLVVQASVLSRRWRDLWKSAVDLSFSEDDFRTPSSSDTDSSDDAAESLSNFIETVLLLRDRSYDIRRFRLHCSQWIHQKRLSTWLRVVALSRNLRELDVSIPGGSDLPSNVFTCGSLRDLGLRMQYWEIRLPNPTRLSNLRTLRISDVDFLNRDEESKLGDLISWCPLLEHLSLIRCYFSSITIRAPNLERLTFHHHDYNDVKVRLSTPKLKFLDHVCDGTEDFSMGNLPCLTEGSFDLRSYTWSTVWDIVDILRSLSNAEVLTLTDFAITYADQLPSNYPDLVEVVPVFHNLRFLRLINSLERDIFQSVKCLLQHMPNLGTLVIQEPVAYEICPFFEDELSYWKRKVLPLDFLQRTENVCVKQKRSCGCMYYVVKFTFLNFNHLDGKSCCSDSGTSFY